MNLVDKPELLSRLAAAYAVGTLRGGARRRFEALARTQAPVRAQALVWEARIAGLVELQGTQTVPPALWQRIDNLIQADLERDRLFKQREQARARGLAGPRRGDWWHWATAASLATAVVTGIVGWRAIGDRDERLAALGSEREAARGALAAASSQVVRLQAELAGQPRVEYVAVLADERSGASVLVTFDPTARRLTLQRVGTYQEGADRSLQLWAVTPGGTPRSLGVLDSTKVMRISADASMVASAPVLAISLEPKGGVSGETGPSGPVLFKGALLKTAL